MNTSLLSGLASKAEGLVQSAKHAVQAVTNSNSGGNFVDNVKELATVKIRSMLDGMQLDEVIAAIEQYQKDKGKDVSGLINILVELNNFLKNGK